MRRMVRIDTNHESSSHGLSLSSHTAARPPPGHTSLDSQPHPGSQALRAQQGPHDATTKLSGQPEVSGRHLNDVPSEQHSEPLLDCGDLVGTCELDRAVSDPPEGALLDLGSLEAR